MEELIYVVGTAFINDGKLLISMSQRSSKKGKFTLVGGGVEKVKPLKKQQEENVKKKSEKDLIS